MKKITSKFLALLLSLLTVMGTMSTPAFAAEDLTPGEPGALTERYIDESTSRELAPSNTSKSSWVKDAPAIESVLCPFSIPEWFSMYSRSPSSNSNCSQYL